MPEPIHFLRLPDVIKRVGLSKPTIYRLIRAKDFPAPRHQGKVSFWPDNEIHDWQVGKLG